MLIEGPSGVWREGEGVGYPSCPSLFRCHWKGFLLWPIPLPCPQSLVFLWGDGAQGSGNRVQCEQAPGNRKGTRVVLGVPVSHVLTTLITQEAGLDQVCLPARIIGERNQYLCVDLSIMSGGRPELPLREEMDSAVTKYRARS